MTRHPTAAATTHNPDQTPEVPVIDDLIAQFSAESFGEWCRRNFDRFTADPHAISDPGDFTKAEIVGYVQSLPDADANPTQNDQRPLSPNRPRHLPPVSPARA